MATQLNDPRKGLADTQAVFDEWPGPPVPCRCPIPPDQHRGVGRRTRPMALYTSCMGLLLPMMASTAAVSGATFISTREHMNRPRPGPGRSKPGCPGCRKGLKSTECSKAPAWWPRWPSRRCRAGHHDHRHPGLGLLDAPEGVQAACREAHVHDHQVASSGPSPGPRRSPSSAVLTRWPSPVRMLQSRAQLRLVVDNHNLQCPCLILSGDEPGDDKDGPLDVRRVELDSSVVLGHDAGGDAQAQAVGVVLGA